jgi:hypothetical protein
MSGKKVKHMPEEPIRTLFGEQKKLLEEMNDYLLSSGAVFNEVTPWLANGGGWGGCYKYGNPKKTIFGFNIGDGRLLSVRIVCQT